MECSVIHHVVIVLMFLWFLSYLNRSHALFYFLALVYLYLVSFLSFASLSLSLSFGWAKLGFLMDWVKKDSCFGGFFFRFMNGM